MSVVLIPIAIVLVGFGRGGGVFVIGYVIGVLAYFLTRGPGPISLDHFIAKHSAVLLRIREG